MVGIEPLVLENNTTADGIQPRAPRTPGLEDGASPLDLPPEKAMVLAFVAVKTGGGWYGRASDYRRQKP